MKNSISKKKIFISGSTTGIGYAIAKLFSGKGCWVGINGRNIKNLKKAKKKIKNLKIFNYYLNNKKNIIKLKKDLIKKVKKIDFLVCNIGDSNFENNHLNIKKAFENNFFTSVNLIQNLFDIINKNGRIICISSVAGVEYMDGAPFGYSIAKSALHTYIKCFSKIFVRQKIMINAIAPGHILHSSSTWKKKLNQNKFKTLKFIKNNVPINKFGAAKDIAIMCEFLCSKDSKYITGSVFPVDGGLIKKF